MILRKMDKDGPVTADKLTSGFQSFSDLAQGEAHLQQRHSNRRWRGRRGQSAAGV